MLNSLFTSLSIVLISRSLHKTMSGPSSLNLALENVGFIIFRILFHASLDEVNRFKIDELSRGAIGPFLRNRSNYTTKNHELK